MITTGNLHPANFKASQNQEEKEFERTGIRGRNSNGKCTSVKVSSYWGLEI